MAAYDSTAQDLDRLFDAGREVRRTFENEWVLVLAFTLGHQWIKVDGSGRIFPVGMDEDRVTITDNRMRPASRTNIARMTKGDPMWQGVPKDRSDEEIQRARIRESVFEHYWRELELRRRYRLALWYREHTGIGFIKTVWDQTLGQSMRVMAQKGGPVVADPYGQPLTPDRVRDVLGQLNDAQRSQVQDQLEEREITFGDVTCQLRTPFEVIVDPLATDEGLSTAEYIGEEALYSPAYLRKHFNYDAPDSGSPSAGIVEGRMPGMNVFLERSRERRGAAGRRGIKVREMWLLADVEKSGPRGKHCVWIHNGETLLEEDNAYPFLPYTDFRGLPAGRYYPDAPQKDVVSPQVERNKVKSQIAENGERFGNPARLISAESIGLEGNRWQGLPGEEIIYHDMGTPGSVPAYLAAPTMPQYVIDQLGENRETIAAITSQQEVTQGTVPEGVTAASAISQLMEANETMLGLDIDDTAVSLLDVGKKLLWCVRAFAKTDRLARIAGEEASWDIIEFRGEQLGDADADSIQLGSSISQSVAVKQAAIQWVINTLIQNGQAPPPRELRRVLRDYEVGGLEHLFGSLNKTQTQCVDEHRRLLAGEFLGINDYDDDSTHVEEHEDFQRSARYQTRIRQPGGQLLDFLTTQHVNLHRQRMQDAANNAAAAAMIQNDPGGEPTLDPQALAQGNGAIPPTAGLPSPSAPATGG